MFQNIIKFLEHMGMDMALLIAGLSGGLVSLRKDEKLAMWQKILTVISGGLISTYLTPMFMLLLKGVLTEDSRLEYGVAFVVGYAGLKSIELLFAKFGSTINKTEREI